MSHAIWYTAPLTCSGCRQTTPRRGAGLRSAALQPEPGDRWVDVGDVLDIGLLDLADAFVPGTRWPPGATLRALEGWSCPACSAAQAALLIWTDEGEPGWRLVSVEATRLTPQVLVGVHGASRSLRETLYPEQLVLLDRP